MTDRSVNDVRSQLIKLFTDAAASIATRLDAKGMPTVVEQPRSFVTRDEAGGAGTDYRFEPHSNLADFDVLMRASPLLDQEMIDSLRRCSAVVAAKHAGTLPFGFYPNARKLSIDAGHGVGDDGDVVLDGDGCRLCGVAFRGV